MKRIFFGMILASLVLGIVACHTKVWAAEDNRPQNPSGMQSQESLNSNIPFTFCGYENKLAITFYLQVEPDNDLEDEYLDHCEKQADEFAHMLLEPVGRQIEWRGSMLCIEYVGGDTCY